MNAAKRAAAAVVGRVLFELRERLEEPLSPGYRRFIILAPGRTGSQMLVQRCDSHPNVRCFGELLHPEFVGWSASILRPAHKRARATRDDDPLRFLNRHLWHHYSKSIKAVGFKLLYSHLLRHLRPLEPLFRPGNDLSVLWLERRNGFETYLSVLHAHRSGVHQVYQADAVPKLLPVEVNPAHCHDALRRMELRRMVADGIVKSSRVLKLFYEDLVSLPEASNAQICTFLGISNRPMQHTSQKLAKGPLSARVTNLPELRAYFSGTPWESFFTDGAEC